MLHYIFHQPKLNTTYEYLPRSTQRFIDPSLPNTMAGQQQLTWLQKLEAQCKWTTPS